MTQGVSLQVNAAHNAASDAGRHKRCSLPGHARAYKQLTALASAIRLQHYSNTFGVV